MESLIKAVGYIVIAFLATFLALSTAIGFGIFVIIVAKGFNIPHFLSNLRMTIAIALGISGVFGLWLGLVITFIGVSKED